jgi:hypothetical protein
MLYAPLIALASDLRVDLGDDAYCGVLAIALRLVTTVVQDKGKDVWVPGVKRATATLKAAQLRGVWLDPPISLEWAPFFSESETDRQARVTYTNLALAGGIIARKTATRQVAAMFSIADPAAEHEAIEAEAAEAAEYGPLPGEPTDGGSLKTDDKPPAEPDDEVDQ